MTEISFEIAEENPDRRKYGYQTLEKKLQTHSEHVEKRLSRFFFKALLAFALIGITSAGSLLGFGIVLDQSANTSAEIQNQRFDNIYQNCIQQNTRHDRAITRANMILPKQAQKVVSLLVDELQPYVADCKGFAATRVKGTK